MVTKKSLARAKRGDEGYAISIFLVLVVLVLAVVLGVLIANASSKPSVAVVETATVQLASQIVSGVQPSAYATCTYDASSWTPGQHFSCSVWQPTIDGPLPHLPHLMDTAVLTVQSAPLGSSGHYVSVSFASATSPLLVNLDNILTPSSALASSHYALARA